MPAEAGALRSRRALPAGRVTIQDHVDRVKDSLAIIDIEREVHCGSACRTIFISIAVHDAQRFAGRKMKSGIPKRGAFIMMSDVQDMREFMPEYCFKMQAQGSS